MFPEVNRESQFTLLLVETWIHPKLNTCHGRSNWMALGIQPRKKSVFFFSFLHQMLANENLGPRLH